MTIVKYRNPYAAKIAKDRAKRKTKARSVPCNQAPDIPPPSVHAASAVYDRTYLERKKAEASAWSDIRDSLLNGLLRMLTLADLQCSQCEFSATLRCASCVRRPVFCRQHGEAHCHELPMCVLTDNYGKAAGDDNEGIEMMLVTRNDACYINVNSGDGILNSKKLQVDGLLAQGFFPGSPSVPTVAFHIKLLEISLAMYQVGNLSYQRIWEIHCSMFPPSAAQKPQALYERFMRCLQEYMFLKHLCGHGIESSTLPLVATTCFACSSTREHEPIVKVNWYMCESTTPVHGRLFLCKEIFYCCKE
jgi:hypothetical protein